MKLYAFFISLLLVSIFSGCKKSGDSKEIEIACDTSNTVFHQLYSNLVNTSPNLDDVTFDLETHSYTFEVTAPATICTVGYQSLPNFNTTPYLIEIVNNTSGVTEYSGSHLFSATTTSYVAINPVVLVVGDSYTIRRIQTNWNGNIVNTIGRLVYNPNGNLNFPIVNGILKITGSSFYGTGGPDNNWSLPFIDIVFQ